MKTIMVAGITGQTASYLADYLADLEEEIKIIGLVRRSSTPNTSNINHLANIKLTGWEEFLTLEYADVTDAHSIAALVDKYQPDEFYNFAAQSHVKTSFEIPEYTLQSVAVGSINCLEAIRRFSPHTKYYNAGSSEQYGDAIDADGFQRETTPFVPNSPYAVAKVAAFHNVRLYREAYGLFACSGICHNHESPRRLETFVTRKITRYVARLYLARLYDKLNTLPSLALGNLDACRDWGYAADTARAAYMMLQAPFADDYVVSTGETHSVKEFLTFAFDSIDESWEDFVVIDKNMLRPREVPRLKGDSGKLRRKLGWKPQITFEELVIFMVKSDIESLRGTYASY
jgi:GDPmannose 4,6-dehydratase